jgi:asparagine synthase (glutamine-hydrolysing)
VPTPVWRRSKQPYRAPGGAAFIGNRKSEYVEDLLSPNQLRQDGIFDPATVTRLVQKFREGRAIGGRDDMALVGILSTQIMIDRFVNNFSTHGSPYSGTAALHHG